MSQESNTLGNTLVTLVAIVTLSLITYVALQELRKDDGKTTIVPEITIGGEQSQGNAN